MSDNELYAYSTTVAVLGIVAVVVTLMSLIYQFNIRELEFKESMASKRYGQVLEGNVLVWRPLDVEKK